MKRVFTPSNLRLVIEVLLFITLLLVIIPKNTATNAASPEVAAAPDATYWYVCNATNHVAVFLDRVHIFCASTTPVAGAPSLDAGITWFAIPTGPDSAAASRFLSLLQTAVITAKPVWVELDPNDTSGSSFGCGAANCRRIYGVEMR
jgi:hypothetical protein